MFLKSYLFSKFGLLSMYPFLLTNFLKNIPIKSGNKDLFTETLSFWPRRGRIFLYINNVMTISEIFPLHRFIPYHILFFQVSDGRVDSILQRILQRKYLFFQVSDGRIDSILQRNARNGWNISTSCHFGYFIRYEYPLLVFLRYNFILDITVCKYIGLFLHHVTDYFQ